MCVDDDDEDYRVDAMEEEGMVSEEELDAGGKSDGCVRSARAQTAAIRFKYVISTLSHIYNSKRSHCQSYHKLMLSWKQCHGLDLTFLASN